MKRMKLYHAPGSCSQAIRIVLEEAALSAEIIKVDARKHLIETGQDYYEINELGYVPLLELEDGTRLREGPVIALYLADQVPDKRLAPAADSIERYRLLEWMNFLTAEIHKGFIPLLYAVAAGDYLQVARPKLMSRFGWIDRELAEKPFLMGNAFSIADAYLFALTGWGRASWMKSVYHADIDLSALNHLARWYSTVRARSAVSAVLRNEGFGF
jgi:glutathione S-transferase